MLADCLAAATVFSTFPTHFVRLGALIADNTDLKLRLPGIPHARSLILISQPRRTPSDSLCCADADGAVAARHDSQTYRDKLFTDIISFHSVRRLSPCLYVCGLVGVWSTVSWRGRPFSASESVICKCRENTATSVI